MKKTAIVLGAGSRGCAYADYSLNCPQQLEIVGVAEPNEARRKVFAEKYHVPAEGCYSHWREILEQPRMGGRGLCLHNGRYAYGAGDPGSAEGISRTPGETHEQYPGRMPGD